MGEGIAEEGGSECGYCHGVCLHLYLLSFSRSRNSSKAHISNIIYQQAGNKADLEAHRKVDFNEANEYAEANGIIHMETSAKNANNVKALFSEIAKRLPKNTQGGNGEREAFPILPQKQEARNCC